MDGGARTHSRDRGLFFGVLEDKADCSVRWPDGYVYFVAKVKHWVERVVDGHLGLRDFLRSIPKCRDLRTSGTGDLWNTVGFLTSNPDICIWFFYWRWFRHFLRLWWDHRVLMKWFLDFSYFYAFFKISQGYFVFGFLIVGKVVHKISLKLFLQVFLSE